MYRAEEHEEKEETEGACVWLKEYTHGLGLNLAGGSESDEFGMGFWLLGVCGVGSRRKRSCGELELWSRPEWTELEPG